jgi:hypothetical protein
MNVLIVREIDLPAEPVYPFPGRDMFVIAMLIAYMRIYQEYTCESQCESENA